MTRPTPIAQDPYCAPLCLPAPKPMIRKLPWLVLALMFLLGSITYALIPMTAAESGSLPPSCFRVEDGVLYFDRRYYEPEPVLIIPPVVDGQNVTEIADECFRDLTGFTTVLLPNTITRIGDHAFAGCSELRGALLPEGVLSVGEGAFSGCEALESLYIPMSVSSIGWDAFEDCPRLVYIFFNGFHSNWMQMYDQFITPFTWVMCLDGEFQHAAN